MSLQNPVVPNLQNPEVCNPYVTPDFFRGSRKDYMYEYAQAQVCGDKSLCVRIRIISLTSITRKAWESGPNGQGIEAARAHAFLDCAARCACLHKKSELVP